MRLTTDEPDEPYIGRLVSSYGGWNATDPEVRDHLEAGLTRWPDPFYAHFWLGRLYDWSDPTTARIHYERALRAHPGDYRTQLFLGDVLGRVQSFEAARAAFASLLAQHPDSVLIQIGAYRTLASLGQEAEARRHLQRAETLDSSLVEQSVVSHARFQAQVGSWIAGDTEAEQREWAARRLWQHPHYGPTWAVIGGLAIDREAFAEAIDALTKAVHFAPDSVDYRVQLGWARAYSGDVAGATAEFRQAVRMAPTDGPALASLGMVLAESAPAEAEDLLSRASQLRPNDPEVFYQLGRTRSALENYRGAVAAFEMARALAPEAIQVHQALVWAYTLSDRPQDADRAVERLRGIDPAAADALSSALAGLRTMVSTPPNPFGEGWTHAASSSSTDFWARTSEIRWSGLTATVWIGAVPAEGKQREFAATYTDAVGATRARQIVRELVRREVDCAGRRSRAFQGVAYNRDGGVIDSWEDPYPSWASPVPSSVLEGVIEHVCAARR